MNEDRFDELMRDAAQTFHKPPQPDLDAMWEDVESQVWSGDRNGSAIALQRKVRRVPGWVAIAATLVIGIGIGRASMMLNRQAPATTAVAVMTPVTPTASADTAMARPYEIETSQYLDQTAALLIALPSEVRSGRTDPRFTSRAGELLTRTRLLMDSPAADDPAMHDLLEDLELVLMQVVRLQHGSRTQLELINRALEQRDVIPRLRTAVADISAN